MTRPKFAVSSGPQVTSNASKTHAEVVSHSSAPPPQGEASVTMVHVPLAGRRLTSRERPPGKCSRRVDTQRSATAQRLVATKAALSLESNLHLLRCSSMPSATSLSTAVTTA